jgi:hypothetical protein
MERVNHYSSNTTTDISKVSKLKCFINNSKDIYISIGKDTPWPNDTNPPQPSNTVIDILEPLLFKKPNKLLLASETNCGEIKILGKYWNLFLPEEVIKVGNTFEPLPTHIYISCDLDPEELLANSFRVIGLHTEVKLEPEANPYQMSYPISLIKDMGLLHWVSYMTPIERLDNAFPQVEILLDI